MKCDGNGCDGNVDIDNPVKILLGNTGAISACPCDKCNKIFWYHTKDLDPVMTADKKITFLVDGRVATRNGKRFVFV